MVDQIYRFNSSFDDPHYYLFMSCIFPQQEPSISPFHLEPSKWQKAVSALPRLSQSQKNFQNYCSIPFFL